VKDANGILGGGQWSSGDLSVSFSRRTLIAYNILILYNCRCEKIHKIRISVEAAFGRFLDHIYIYIIS